MVVLTIGQLNGTASSCSCWAAAGASAVVGVVCCLVRVCGSGSCCLLIIYNEAVCNAI